MMQSVLSGPLYSDVPKLVELPDPCVTVFDSHGLPPSYRNPDLFAGSDSRDAGLFCSCFRCISAFLKFFHLIFTPSPFRPFILFLRVIRSRAFFALPRDAFSVGLPCFFGVLHSCSPDVSNAQN